MVAVVTLHVNNCAGGAALSGAAVTDGYNTVYTNAYGEIAVYWDDTAYVGYGVSISKSGFTTRAVNVYNSQNGTTVTTCLDQAATPPPTGGGGGSSWHCFIVSATTGSPESDDIEALRDLRDRVAARSVLAERLIAAVYDEYWQFSPEIAERIKVDAAMKYGALTAVVQPLLGWYRLAGALALGGDASGAQQTLAEACPEWLRPAELAGLIERIRRERTLPADTPQAVREIAGPLLKAVSLPLVDWAILSPLESCWSLAAQPSDPARAIANWMASAPLAPIREAAASEIDAMAALLGFDPGAQVRLLDRLKTSKSTCGCAQR